MMPGLWRNNAAHPEGKYLVLRRDGTVPEWSWFVLGSRDPAAAAALLTYADAAEKLGYDPAFVEDVRALSRSWVSEQKLSGSSLEARNDRQPPDGPRHRPDDPATVARMREAQARGGGSA